MSVKLDRGILQVTHHPDPRQVTARNNERLRAVSERIAKLEGRSGVQQILNALKIRSDKYSLLEFEGELTGKAAISATTGASRTLEFAKGARRADDKQWIATDTGAVILQMGADGSLTMYANTGLTEGAAFAPTQVWTFASTGASTVDHGNLLASSLLDNDHPLYQRKHGFVVGSDGARQLNISYNKTTRKVTLTPTGSTFTFYIDGVQYIKSGAQESGAHAATTGKHYFYYDANGALQTSTTAWGIKDRTIIPAALVYYYSGLSDGICFYETHTADRTLEQHYHDHFSQGTQRISGFAISGYTLDTGSDAAVTFAVASGVIADEDLATTLSALSDGGPYTVMYRTGAAGDWTWDSTPTLPFLGTTYPAWNNINAGGSGVWGLSDVSGLGLGEWVNYYLVAVPSVTAATQLVLIPGQAVHTSLASATGESLGSIAWGTVPFEEICPLYRLTFHGRSTFGGTKKARLEQVTTITSGGASIIQASSPAIHNSLSSRDAADAHPASSITYSAAAPITSTTVQAALDEVGTELAFSGARVYNSANLTGFTGSAAVLTFDSESFDIGGYHSTVTNTSRLTAPVAGYYLIQAHIRWEVNGTGERRMRFEKNSAGTPTAANVIAYNAVEAVAGGSLPTDQNLSTITVLSAGDYVELFAAQSSGSTLHIANVAGVPNAASPVFMITFLGY